MEEQSNLKSAVAVSSEAVAKILTRDQWVWLIFCVGLPAMCFGVLSTCNYEYVSRLFLDPRGRKMLLIAILQLAVLALVYAAICIFVNRSQWSAQRPRASYWLAIPLNLCMLAFGTLPACFVVLVGPGGLVVYDQLLEMDEHRRVQSSNPANTIAAPVNN